jgi:outer membrane protein OmpA-like peptidoglycan-associated protein
MKILFLGSILILFTQLAQANVNVNLLEHSHSSVYMLTEDTLTKQSLPNETLIFSGYYNYVEDPVVITNADRTKRVGTMIEGITAFHYGVGYQMSNRFLVGLSSFAANVYSPDRQGTWTNGDTKLMGKYRMTADRAKNSFAIISQFDLPTGNEEFFVGNGGFGAGLKLAYERDFGKFQVNANLGFMNNSKAIFRDLDYRKKLLMALGTFIPLNDTWGIVAEGTMARTFKKYQNPGEIYAGARYKYSKNFSISAGASVGDLGETGAGEFRLVAGVKYIPFLKNGPFRWKNYFTKKEREMIKRMLEINDEIQFDHDSNQLTDAGRDALKRIAQIMKEEGTTFKKVVVSGHANKVGTEEYNASLSNRRAAAVRNYLLEQGISPDYLKTEAHGESMPKAIQDWSKAKVQNRRVEFKVLK